MFLIQRIRTSEYLILQGTNATWTPHKIAATTFHNDPSHFSEINKILRVSKAKVVESK